MFRFTFKMLSEGAAVLPAKGMQEIPDQLVGALPVTAVRYGVTVTQVLQEHGRTVGVETQDGEQIAAEAVVVATDPPAAQALGAERIPSQPVACLCVYFTISTSLYGGKMIVLNANPDPYVHHLAQLTNVVPSYAPEGRHLLSLTILGDRPESEAEIEGRCRQELAALFPGKSLTGLRLLRIVRIPFAQFAQPPGIYRALPGNTTTVPGLYLASEVTASSSIQGAMQSGETAAQLVLEGRRTPAPAEVG